MVIGTVNFVVQGGGGQKINDAIFVYHGISLAVFQTLTVIPV